MTEPRVQLVNPTNGRVVEQQCSAIPRLLERGYSFASDEDEATFDSWRGGDQPGEVDPPLELEPVNATPSAVALATANGIDLATVEGSGADGRILKRDVEATL